MKIRTNSRRYGDAEMADIMELIDSQLYTYDQIAEKMSARYDRNYTGNGISLAVSRYRKKQSGQ